jgi:ATP-binding cassette, subfamily B, bacterial
VQVYPTHLLFTRLYMGVVRRIAAGLRNQAVARLQVLSVGYMRRTSAAVVQNKIVRDVENIELMFGQIGNPLGGAIVVFCGAVAMTALNVPQFLPIYALALPCGVAIWWAMRRRTEERNAAFRLQMEQFARGVGDMTVLMPLSRAHGLETESVRRVSEDTEGVRRHGLSLDMANGQFGAVSWVAMQVLAVGCLLGAAALSVTGSIPITPGQVVLLGTYFTTLTGTVLTVLNFIPVVARGRESARSLAELLDEPDVELNEGKHAVSDIAGGFRLENVRVVFPGQETPALSNVNLSIAAGTTVAFVGSSGSGKSTLVNTILGFVRPTAGRILLDGNDMNTLDLRSVRKRISVVPQDSVLFEGTIRENITFGLDNVTDKEISAALEHSNAMELVESLPECWDTLVGQGGGKLSGGQRQRISIARALLRNPRVLVLDEATSALDPESEAKVQAGLQYLMHDRTTLIVAHRLSTVMQADLIVVLEGGRIVESGSHADLIRLGGRYERLWHLQNPYVQTAKATRPDPARADPPAKDDARPQ